MYSFLHETNWKWKIKHKMFDVKYDYLYHIGIFIINYNVILIYTCVHNLKASAIVLYQTYNCVLSLYKFAGKMASAELITNTRLILNAAYRWATVASSIGLKLLSLLSSFLPDIYETIDHARSTLSRWLKLFYYLSFAVCLHNNILSTFYYTFLITHKST